MPGARVCCRDVATCSDMRYRRTKRIGIKKIALQTPQISCHESCKNISTFTCCIWTTRLMYIYINIYIYIIRVYERMNDYEITPWFLNDPSAMGKCLASRFWGICCLPSQESRWHVDHLSRFPNATNVWSETSRWWSIYIYILFVYIYIYCIHIHIHIYIYIVYIYIYIYIWAIVKTLGSRKGHPQIWEGPIAYHTFVQ